MKSYPYDGPDAPLGTISRELIVSRPPTHEAWLADAP